MKAPLKEKLTSIFFSHIFPPNIILRPLLCEQVVWTTSTLNQQRQPLIVVALKSIELRVQTRKAKS